MSASCSCCRAWNTAPQTLRFGSVRERCANSIHSGQMLMIILQKAATLILIVDWVKFRGCLT